MRGFLFFGGINFWQAIPGKRSHIPKREGCFLANQGGTAETCRFRPFVGSAGFYNYFNGGLKW